MSNPVTENIVARLRAQQAAVQKKAAEDTGVADIYDRGTASVAADPAADNANAALPPNASGDPGSRNDNGLLSGTRAGLNSPVPAAGSQNDKDDAATSPTTDLSKIANNLRAVMSQVKGAANATAPATPAAPAAQPKQAAQPGWEPEVLQKLASEFGLAPEQVAEMTPDAFAEFTRTKLAHTMAMILEVEGGAETVAHLLEKKAGADEARMVMAQAINSYNAASNEMQLKQAAAQEELAQLEAVQGMLAGRYQELTKNASQADLSKMARYEAIITKAASKLEGEQLSAFLLGMKRAAADMAALEEGADPASLENSLPEEDMAAIDEQALQAAIAQAIQEGKITPEMAAQIIDELSGGAGEGMEGEEESPEAEMAEEDLKTAAAHLGINW